MKLFLVLIAFTSTILVKAQTTTSDVWINEFHYDGLTTYGQSDQGEFVELVMKTSIVNDAVEFAKYSLVLYTVGALDNVLLTPGRGLPYNTASPLYTAAETVHPLTTFTTTASGTVGFTMLCKNLPILLDLPGALAIVYDNTTVVQLLSYEKSFKIAPAPGGGAAAGLTTTLMLTGGGQPADETALSTTVHAVSLIGVGNTYSQFTWDDDIARMATPCAVNNGQTLLGGVLAVQWLDLRATAMRNDIYLQWKLGDETNTLRYEIELRNNGNFARVATVPKDPALNGEYNHRLLQLPEGVYRLRIKAVDADGSFSYSAERQVKIGDQSGSISIYPNPASDKSVMVQIVPQQRNGYIISVIDGIGRTMMQQKADGLQINQINTIPLRLQNLKPGTYMIQVVNGYERYSVSLVIVD